MSSSFNENSNLEAAFSINPIINGRNQQIQRTIYSQSKEDIDGDKYVLNLDKVIFS